MIKPHSEMEHRLVQLKESGASPIEAIRALHDEFGLSLREAKLRFAQSPEWAAEAGAAEPLHEQVADALRNEGTN